MNLFGHEIDLTSKEIWISVIIFLTYYLWHENFQIHSSEFVCNPQKCEVISKNMKGRTINKQPIDIANIERFNTKVFYSKYEDSKRESSNRRSTVYAITKNGKSYRFFKNSYSKSDKNQTDAIVNILNKHLPTTQEKADINISF